MVEGMATNLDYPSSCATNVYTLVRESALVSPPLLNLLAE